MALTTAADMTTLSSRSFLTDYANNRTGFVEVGKIVYRALLTHGGSAPAAADMQDPVHVALQSTNIFRIVCAGKSHLNPMYYPTCALGLARYMLDNDWSDVSSP